MVRLRLGQNRLACNLAALIRIDLNRIFLDRHYLLHCEVLLLLGEISGHHELLIFFKGVFKLFITEYISLTILLNVFTNLVEDGIPEDLSDAKDTNGTCRATLFGLTWILIDKTNVSDSSQLLLKVDNLLLIFARLLTCGIDI